MRQLFRGVGVDEAETARTMVATLNESGQLIDPHTAVGVAAAQRTADATRPLVVLSTAHPAKFPESVGKVTGVSPQLPRSVAAMAAKPERFDRLPADAETIKAYVRAFAEG
jgi:threonine synthase